MVLRHPEAVRPWQHVLDCLAGYLTLAEALDRRPSRVLRRVELRTRGFGFAPGFLRRRGLGVALGCAAAWVQDNADHAPEEKMLRLDVTQGRHRSGRTLPAVDRRCGPVGGRLVSRFPPRPGRARLCLAQIAPTAALAPQFRLKRRRERLGGRVRHGASFGWQALLGMRTEMRRDRASLAGGGELAGATHSDFDRPYGIS